MSNRLIVAIGGAGFAAEEEPPLFEQFLCEATGKDEPRVCFLPTATGDSRDYIVNFYWAFRGLSCRPTHLSLFGHPIADLRGFLLAQDVIYVGGGNTANMLAVWRIHGIDKVLREAWERGIVLSGVSAGTNCWFDASITDSFGVELKALNDGLGLLNGGACPHYDGEERRRPTLHKALLAGFPQTYAVEDHAALVFSGTELREVIATSPTARAFKVEVKEGVVVEQELQTRYLSQK